MYRYPYKPKIQNSNSPELGIIRKYEYVKPTPSPNDMNSMCSFSPKEINLDFKQRITQGYGTVSKFKQKHEATKMRLSENRTISTFRTRNVLPKRKKKISLKKRSAYQDKSKELNSIDEKTPKSGSQKKTPIQKFESGNRNNTSDVSPMTSPPRLMMQDQNPSQAQDDTEAAKIARFSNKRRNQHSGSLEPHRMSYMEKNKLTEKNFQKANITKAPNANTGSMSRNISKESTSGLNYATSPDEVEAKEYEKDPMMMNFTNYFSNQKPRNPLLEKVQNQFQIESLSKQSKMSENGSVFSNSINLQNPKNTPNPRRKFIMNHQLDSMKNSGIVTSTIMSPQKSLHNNRMSVEGFSNANSNSEASFPFHIQPKVQQYNIYENYSIGTIDQLSRKFDPQSYRNSTCFSAYSRGKFDTRRESKIITNNTSQILDGKMIGYSEDVTPVDNKRKEVIFNKNFTINKKFKNVDNRASSGDKEKIKRKSVISIDEAEVIKRRFTHDPLKNAKRPVKLDKYGKNHINEPKYIRGKFRSVTKQPSSRRHYHDTDEGQNGSKIVPVNKNLFKGGLRRSPSPKDKKIQGILKPRLSKFSQSRSNSVQFKPSSGARESSPFNNANPNQDQMESITSINNTNNKIADFSQKNEASVPSQNQSSPEPKPFKGYSKSKTNGDIKDSSKFPSIQEERLSAFSRKSASTSQKKIQFSQTFEMLRAVNGLESSSLSKNENISPQISKQKFKPDSKPQENEKEQKDQKSSSQDDEPYNPKSLKKKTTVDEVLNSRTQNSQFIPSPPRYASKITEAMTEESNSSSDSTNRSLAEEILSSSSVKKSSQLQSIHFNLDLEDKNNSKTQLKKFDSQPDKNLKEQNIAKINIKNNPLEKDFLQSPIMSTQYNYSQTQNTPSHNNMGSQGKRSQIGTKISDLSSRNLQNIRSNPGNESPKDAPNNSGINTVNPDSQSKSTILKFNSPTENKESTKSIKNIRQTLKHYTNHANNGEDERETQGRRINTQDHQRNNTTRDRMSHRTYNTYDSASSKKYGVRYDSIALDSSKRKSLRSDMNTDNIPTKRMKYNTSKKVSPRDSNRYSTSHRSKTVKNSRYSNSRYKDNMNNSINMLSVSKVDPLEIDHSPVKDRLTRLPEHYFEAFDSVQITKDLLYIGPIDKTTGKFNGFGRVMTSKGELIYEGKLSFLTNLTRQFLPRKI